MIDLLSAEATNIMEQRLTIPDVFYEFLTHKIQENHATVGFLYHYMLRWFSMQQ